MLRLAAYMKAHPSLTSAEVAAGIGSTVAFVNRYSAAIRARYDIKPPRGKVAGAKRRVRIVERLKTLLAQLEDVL